MNSVGSANSGEIGLFLPDCVRLHLNCFNRAVYSGVDDRVSALITHVPARKSKFLVKAHAARLHGKKIQGNHDT